MHHWFIYLLLKNINSSVIPHIYLNVDIMVHSSNELNVLRLRAQCLWYYHDYVVKKTDGGFERLPSVAFLQARSLYLEKQFL